MDTAAIQPPDDGRFEIVRRLGAGAMGVVYHARDRHRGNRAVALKLLTRFDASALYRFKREFRALAEVVHPNLVSLYELVNAGDQWMITMELLEGVSFTRHVRGGEDAGDVPSTPPARAPRASDDTGATAPLNARQPPRTAPSTSRLASHDEIERLRAALAQLVEGVSAIHRAGKLHRDLKPSNVMVEPDGRVAVLDFGIATGLRGSDATHVGDIAGTPAYMAPEQARGEALTEACDWYAVGVMMYESLAGHRPFEGHAEEIMAAKNARAPVAVDYLFPDAPPDLAELCMALLELDPAARPSGAELRAKLGGGDTPRRRRDSIAAPRSSDALLIGRDREMATLNAELTRVLDGAARVVHVRGDSGMGKSALIEEFLAGVERDGSAVVLRGRCYERESVPYKALDALVDALTMHVLSLPEESLWPLLPPGIAALVKLFPVLRQSDVILTAAAAAALGADPVGVRRDAFAALRHLLVKLAERGPLVLHIDDLQWGDTESADLLAEVFREPGAPRALLLLSYRPDDNTSPFLRAFLAARGDDTLVPLRRLSLASARDLTRELLTRRGVAPGPLAVSIAREAGGSPLFVRELVHYVLGRGAPTELLAESLDISLEELLCQRVDGFPSEAATLIELIAVAAGPLPREIALATAGLDASATTLLAELGNARLVRTRGLGQDAVIETAHDRVREAMVARLSTDELRRYHAHIAEALESWDGADPEAIAVHLDAAGAPTRAVHYYARAAADAAGALAFDRAAALYTRALERSPSDTPERHEMRIELGTVLGLAGRSTEAADAYLMAAAEAEQSGDARSHDLRRLAAEHFLFAGHIDRGVQVLERVLADVGIGPSAATGTTKLLRVVWQRMLLARRGRQAVVRERPLEPREQAYLQACWGALIGFSTVDTLRGVEFTARYLRAALRSGDAFHLSRALGAEACLSCLPGGRAHDRARALVSRGQAIARQLGDPVADAWAHSYEGFTAYQRGEWQVGRDVLQAAIDKFALHRTGAAWQIVSSELYRVWCLYYLGDLGELARVVPALRTNARDRGDLYSFVNLSTGLPAFEGLITDDPTGVRSRAATAMADWSPSGVHLQHYWETFAVVMSELYEGNGPGALGRLQADWPRFEAAMFLRIQMVRNELLTLRATAHLACARRGADVAGPALAKAERDARTLERCDVLGFRHIGATLRAGIAAHRGDTDQARTLLRSAIAGFEKQNMAMHAAAARVRLGHVSDAADDAAQADRALRWFRDRGVVAPSKLAALLATS